MKKILTILSVSVLCVSAQVTNVSVTVNKNLTSDELSNIVAGVNALQVAPVALTPDQLGGAYVVPVNDGYQVRVTLAPVVITVNTNSDTGLSYTVRTSVNMPQIPTFSLNQGQMQSIFDVAIGNVGNMNPPITITNFAFIRLAKDTNDDWTVTSKIK